jgi:putative lumazine-binding protein
MNTLTLANQDIDQVTAIVHDYFDGLHNANIEKLERIFHPDTYLKAPGLRRNLAQWLDLVKQRAVPAKEGADYAYRILSVDIVNEQAMVKLVCPLHARTYIDFLGLLKENGHWLIVNKMYADLQ